MTFNDSGDELVDRNWPNTTLDNRGVWHSTWTIVVESLPADCPLHEIAADFTRRLSSIVKSVTNNSKEQFCVSIDSSENILTIEVATSSHIIGAECWFALDQLFNLVDENIGTILSIQGQPKVSWQLGS